jgi:heme-degrading monooxygenase HmoA
MYVIIWKFTVKPGLEDDFEKVYGPDGVWAQYFRRGHGYIETELLRGASAPGNYVTIDRWDSQAAYESFRTRFAAGYSAIDQECEVLTESESELGTYELVAPKLLGGNNQDDGKP